MSQAPCLEEEEEGLDPPGGFIQCHLRCAGAAVRHVQKSKHVPFRNSKLTSILQGSLRGQSKVLMVVNVSPAPALLESTLSTLRFGTKVCGR